MGHHSLLKRVNSKMLIISIMISLAMCITVYTSEQFYISQMYGIVSLADSLTIVNRMNVSCVILPLFCLWTILFQKNDFRKEVVIHQKARSIIWEKQCERIILLSIVTASLVIMMAILSQMNKARCLMNWNSIDSAFYHYSSIIAVQRFTFEGTFAECIIFTWINMVIRLSIAAIFVTMLFWVFCNYLFGMGVVITTVLVETWTAFCNLFWQNISIKVTDYRSMLTLLTKLIIVTLLLLFLLLVGNIVSKHKDFL